jgi:hypothetical protein
MEAPYVLKEEPYILKCFSVQNVRYVPFYSSFMFCTSSDALCIGNALEQEHEQNMGTTSLDDCLILGSYLSRILFP